MRKRKSSLYIISKYLLVLLSTFLTLGLSPPRDMVSGQEKTERLFSIYGGKWGGLIRAQIEGLPVHKTTGVTIPFFDEVVQANIRLTQEGDLIAQNIEGIVHNLLDAFSRVTDVHHLRFLLGKYFQAPGETTPLFLQPIVDPQLILSQLLTNPTMISDQQFKICQKMIHDFKDEDTVRAAVHNYLEQLASRVQLTDQFREELVRQVQDFEGEIFLRSSEEHEGTFEQSLSGQGVSLRCQKNEAIATAEQLIRRHIANVWIKGEVLSRHRLAIPINSYLHSVTGALCRYEGDKVYIEAVVGDTDTATSPQHANATLIVADRNSREIQVHHPFVRTPYKIQFYGKEYTSDKNPEQLESLWKRQTSWISLEGDKRLRSPLTEDQILELADFAVGEKLGYSVLTEVKLLKNPNDGTKRFEFSQVIPATRKNRVVEQREKIAEPPQRSTTAYLSMGERQANAPAVMVPRNADRNQAKKQIAQLAQLMLPQGIILVAQDAASYGAIPGVVGYIDPYAGSLDSHNINFLSDVLVKDPWQFIYVCGPNLQQFLRKELTWKQIIPGAFGDFPLLRISGQELMIIPLQENQSLIAMNDSQPRAEVEKTEFEKEIEEHLKTSRTIHGARGRIDELLLDHIRNEDFTVTNMFLYHLVKAREAENNKDYLGAIPLEVFTDYALQFGVTFMQAIQSVLEPYLQILNRPVYPADHEHPFVKGMREVNLSHYLSWWQDSPETIFNGIEEAQKRRGIYLAKTPLLRIKEYYQKVETILEAFKKERNIEPNSEGVILSDTFRVLIVDDNRWNRVKFSNLLANSGISAMETANSQEALMAIQKNPPDFGIFDTVVPGETDYKQLARLCKKLNPHFRGVVVSAANRVSIEDEGLVPAGIIASFCSTTEGGVMNQKILEQAQLARQTKMDLVAGQRKRLLSRDLRMMVVDDDDVRRMIFSEWFKRENFTDVSFYSNIAEALPAISSNNPDVIFIDMVVETQFVGEDTIRRIAQLDTLIKPKIVAYSAVLRREQWEQLERLRPLGVVKIMEFPERKDIISLLRSLDARRKAEQEDLRRKLQGEPSPYRILILDDRRTIADGLATRLSSILLQEDPNATYTIEWKSNVGKMIQAVVNFNPDLVILDQILNNDEIDGDSIDGDSIAREIRKQFFTPDVILMTGGDLSVEQYERLLPFGIVGQIGKSFADRELEWFVQQIIRLRTRKLGTNPVPSLKSTEALHSAL